MQTVIGLFATAEDAERAVSLLTQAGGFDLEEISCLEPGDVREPSWGRRAAVGLGSGVVVGAVAGGLLGAASTAAPAGIGPIAPAGAVLPAAVGVVTGASTGGTAGTLLGAASAGDAAAYFLQEVRGGRILLGVTADRLEPARERLAQSGALEVSDVGATATADRLAEPDQDVQRVEPR